MTNFDDVDDQLIVDDLIQDSIVPLAGSVFLLAGEFLTSGRVWITGKASDLFYDSDSILLFDFFDFLRSRLFDDEPIAFHFSSRRLRTFRNRGQVHSPSL